MLSCKQKCVFFPESVLCVVPLGVTPEGFNRHRVLTPLSYQAANPSPPGRTWVHTTPVPTHSFTYIHPTTHIYAHLMARPPLFNPGD